MGKNDIWTKIQNMSYSMPNQSYLYLTMHTRDTTLHQPACQISAWMVEDILRKGEKSKERISHAQSMHNYTCHRHQLH